LGGALNGNIGVMRTNLQLRNKMISEIIREKKYQSRAFLLMPMTFNVGVIVGPILGGMLADPVASFPQVFGPESLIGGKKGVGWMTRWPYALPNLMSALFLFVGAMALVLGLEETHEALRGKQDYGLRLGQWLSRLCTRRKPLHAYSAISTSESLGPVSSSGDIELQQAPRHPSPTTRKRKLPFRRIWTRSVLFTFLAHGLLAAHVGTFNSLWFVFLSTPRYDAAPSASSNSSASLGLPPDYHPHPPFSFTGGLALPPPSIGFALAVIGVIGISLQIFLYPTLSTKLGTSKSYRLALLFFPLAYTLVPFLAQIPTRSKPPHQADGVLVWIGITSVLFVQVLARTFALPATIILINNCSPHPSVLSTIHGIGQSVSSGTRTIGPILGGWLYGLGLSHGVVGAAWWGLAGVAICGAVAARWVREGNGHEILLEGEENEEAKS
ncbi:hypothetical protein LTR04_001402, partial [Oleoguttula sp. CCFEE 6159]